MAFEQRALAGAVGAEQGHDLAGADREVDAVQHADLAVAGRQAADLEQWFESVGAEVGTDHLPVGADFSRRAGGQLLAEIEHRHAIADVEDQVGMMLDQQHASALAADRLDQRTEPLDLLGRQAGGRLVEHQESRPQHQGAGDLDEAQLAVLQAVGTHVGQRFETHGRKRLHRRLAQQLLVAAIARQRQHRLGEGRLAVHRAADHDVLEHRGGAHDARRLERAGNAVVGAGMRLVERHVGAVQLHRAGLGLVVARDHVQRRGLAAAVGADQAMDLARADFQVEPIDRPHAAEMQRDVLEHDAVLAVRPVERALQEFRSRHDLAMLGERPAVLEIEHVGDAARHQQHDRQQEHGV